MQGKLTLLLVALSGAVLIGISKAPEPGGSTRSGVRVQAPIATAGASSVPTAPSRITHTIDLDKPGEPILLDLELPVAIFVRALIPSGHYIFEVTSKELAPRSRQAFTPTWPTITPIGEVCERRQIALQRVLQASTPEEAASLATDHRNAPADQRCATLESTMEVVLKTLGQEVFFPLTEMSGDRPYTPLKLIARRVNEKNETLKLMEWPIVMADTRAGGTEERWIIEDTLRAIARSAGTDPPIGVREEVDWSKGHIARVGSEPQEVHIGRPAWDPDAFVVFAKTRVWPPDRRSSVPIDLSWFSEPTAPRLMAASASLARPLANSPGTAENHDAAALLLGALALRTPEGLWSDPRLLINAMTAHIAISEARGPRPRLTRTLARAVVDILAGREVAADDRLRAAQTGKLTAEQQSWVRALRMRASGDWRLYFAKGRTITTFEKAEYTGALARSWSPDRALKAWEQEMGAIASPEWLRPLFRPRLSVSL